MPQVASDSTIQAANRPLPRPSRPPASDAPPSPFESLLDDTNSPPPAAEAPPPDNKVSAPDNSRPPAKTDDTQAAAAANDEPPAAPENAVTTIQQPSNKKDTADDGKTEITAKTSSDVGKSLTTDGDQKSVSDQKTDKTDAAAQAGAALAPATQQLTVAAPVPVPVQIQAADAAGKTGPVLQQAALSAEITTQLKPVGPAPSKTDSAKTSDDTKKSDTGVNSTSTAPTLDDLTGSLQLTSSGGATSHTDDKQQPAASGEADKQRAAQARGDSPAGNHQQSDATSQPVVNVDANAPLPQATNAAMAQQTTISAPQQAADPAAAANLASQPLLQAAPIPLAGLAVEIAGKAFAGKNRFEIRLDPPELGRIEVRLDVDRDGNVTSRLTVDRPDTLNLLQRDASGLERALQDAGLKTADNGLQFSLRDQTMGQQQTNTGSNTAQLLVKDETMPAIDVIPQSYSRLAGLGGGLDIRV